MHSFHNPLLLWIKPRTMEDEPVPQQPTPEQPAPPPYKPLNQAIDLVRQAVEEDRNSNFVAAFRLYRQSLEHFMVACRYERNPSSKQLIMDKMNEYMTRAEQIKAFLESQGKK
ncbi:Vacuolar protein sorting-associated protein 4B [Aphanomyces cochlioides]|nr:Vacuolar protein sorting-associated protein 4B [Aphanomyces cochlioides]